MRGNYAHTATGREGLLIGVNVKRKGKRVKTWISNCRDCGAVIDWEGEGGILWAGDVFCSSHDPLEPAEEVSV